MTALRNQHRSGFRGHYVQLFGPPFGPASCFLRILPNCSASVIRNASCPSSRPVSAWDRSSVMFAYRITPTRNLRGSPLNRTIRPPDRTAVQPHSGSSSGRPLDAGLPAESSPRDRSSPARADRPARSPRRRSTRECSRSPCARGDSGCAHQPRSQRDGRWPEHRVYRRTRDGPSRTGSEPDRSSSNQRCGVRHVSPEPRLDTPTSGGKFAGRVATRPGTAIPRMYRDR